MTISFFLPVWLLWLGGITLGCVVLALAVVGVLFIWNFKDGIY